MGIKLLAGDFGQGPAKLDTLLGDCTLIVSVGLLRTMKVDLKKDLDYVEIQTEESIKKLAGTAAWGLAGAVLLGPAGLLAGLLLGGRGKEVVFAAYLKDGRKFLAVADSKTFRHIQAAAFGSAKEADTV